MEFFWNCKSRELRLIFPRGLHVPRVLDAYETLFVSARLLAGEGRRQSLPRNNNFLFLKACTEEVLTFPQAQVVRNSRKRWRVPNTLSNESPS